jgi:hypothetical protein
MAGAGRNGMYATKKIPKGGKMSAINKVVSSGLLSASGAISANPGGLTGISCFTNGAANATLTIYDNASAGSGTVLAQISVPGASLCASQSFPSNVKAVNGIYATLAGTGASYIVLSEI